MEGIFLENEMKRFYTLLTLLIVVLVLLTINDYGNQDNELIIDGIGSGHNG